MPTCHMYYQGCGSMVRCHSEYCCMTMGLRGCQGSRNARPSRGEASLSRKGSDKRAVQPVLHVIAWLQDCQLLSGHAELIQLCQLMKTEQYIAPESDGGSAPTKKSQRSLDTQ